MKEPLWWVTKDGDRTCRRLYERHYSCYRYRDGRRPRKFVGPGEYIALRTAAGDAFFVWRKFLDASGQTGINCAAFRNEGAHQSSDLIRQADAVADLCWPGERHYTYVNPKRVRSCNPGYCFLVAGWRRCGRTKGGLLILEREPIVNRRSQIVDGKGDDDGEVEPKSGHDIDIWGDGSPTRSTPIPEEWERFHHEGHEEHEGT